MKPTRSPHAAAGDAGAAARVAFVYDQVALVRLFAALEAALAARGVRGRHLVVGADAAAAARESGAADVRRWEPADAPVKTGRCERLDAAARVEAALRGDGPADEVDAGRLVRRHLPTARTQLDGCSGAVTWGAYRAHSATALAVGEERDLPTWICEMGLFRPETLTVDRRGILARSSVPRDPSFYRDLELDERRLDAFLDRFTATPSHRDTIYASQRPLGRLLAGPALRRLSRFTAGSTVATALKYVLRLRWRETTFRDYVAWQRRYGVLRGLADPVDEQRPFVLFPLQLTADAQWVLHRRGLRSQGDVVETIARTLERRGDGVVLAVKAHPADPWSVAEFRAALDAGRPLVLYQSRDVRSLLRAARAVVTVNSTTGIEALACGIPVITLGDCLYEVPGVVCSVRDLAALPEALSAALDEPARDPGLRRALLYYLRFHYQYEINLARCVSDTPGVVRLADEVVAELRSRR